MYSDEGQAYELRVTHVEGTVTDDDSDSGEEEDTISTDAPSEAPTIASGQECEDYTLTDVM